MLVSVFDRHLPELAGENAGIHFRLKELVRRFDDGLARLYARSLVVVFISEHDFPHLHTDTFRLILELRYGASELGPVVSVELLSAYFCDVLPDVGEVEVKRRLRVRGESFFYHARDGRRLENEHLADALGVVLLCFVAE